MENFKCSYTKIFADVGVEISDYNVNNWKPLMRQCLISSGVSALYFLFGLFLGAPTVLIAQIQKDVNSTETINDEMISWLTTLPVVSSVPFLIILLLLFNKIGRKFTLLFVWSVMLIGFIIFYNATTIYHVLISELCAGAMAAATVTITPVIISEYTSPKYRGIFLALKSASAFWGIWVSNAIGTFYHWKNIAVVAFICSIHLISLIVWPESPFWLAKKGRYVDSAKSHRWLKGVDEDSEKELAQLIRSQKYDINSELSENRNNKSNLLNLSRIRSVVTSRPFYRPTLICITLYSQYDFTGKFVITMYAIEVIKRSLPDQSFVYKTMLILDGVTVFSMYVGCVISRYYNRRTLLLLFSGTGITALYILSAYLYLSTMSIITKNNIFILVLLSIFSIAIGCGPMILCTSIYGEIIPPRYQNFTMISVSLCNIFTGSVILKISPFMFKYFEMHGCFLFFAVSSSIILCILYFYLPETKDKTIQDIEMLFTKAKVTVDEDTDTTLKENECL